MRAWYYIPEAPAPMIATDLIDFSAPMIYSETDAGLVYLCRVF